MEKLRATFHVSFSTKVIVPVVATMVLLMGITVWMVNERLTEQFQAEAAHNLDRAAAEFQVARRSSTRNLVERLKNLRNEPRYKALLASGHVPTLAEELKNLPAEQGVDVALFTSDLGKPLVKIKGDPQIVLSQFETNSSYAVRRALQGEETVDIVEAGDDLFDVVSIPVTSSKGALIGVLTFGLQIRNTDVREFKATSQSEIVLLADGHVITSTALADSHLDFARLFRDSLTNSVAGRSPAPIKEVLLGGGHYFCSAGKFPTLSGKENLGYLLLCSYEQPLRALRGTQQMLLAVSALGILIGTAVVWFLVR
jgi:hypothetical protein